MYSHFVRFWISHTDNNRGSLKTKEIELSVEEKKSIEKSTKKSIYSEQIGVALKAMEKGNYSFAETALLLAEATAQSQIEITYTDSLKKEVSAKLKAQKESISTKKQVKTSSQLKEEKILVFGYVQTVAEAKLLEKGITTTFPDILENLKHVSYDSSGEEFIVNSHVILKEAKRRKMNFISRVKFANHKYDLLGFDFL